MTASTKQSLAIKLSRCKRAIRKVKIILCVFPLLSGIIQVPLKLIRLLATVYLSDCGNWEKLHTTKGLYQILFVKNLIYRQEGSTEIIGNFIGPKWSTSSKKANHILWLNGKLFATKNPRIGHQCWLRADRQQTFNNNGTS